MGTLNLNFPTLVHPSISRIGVHKLPKIDLPSNNVQICSHQKLGVRFSAISRTSAYSSSQSDGVEDPQNSLEELRVPSNWSEPSRAAEESEWLRVTLHKWLDEEYCPEPTNIEISKVAATSFYKSLVEKRADIGEIL